MDDLHGVRRNENAEDEASTNRLLEELDRNLNAIKKGTLYEQAERDYQSYVSSRLFRLLFLRTCDYDPIASVQRILTFLEIQEYLFGEEKIGKRILLEDLEEEAIVSLKTGAMQISHSTDNAGRKLLFVYPPAPRVENIRSEAQARYYILMALMESEEVQKIGFVTVYFAAKPTDFSEYRRYSSGKLMYLPLRFAGCHGCVSNWKTYVLEAVSIFAFPASARPKFKIHHCGSDLECLYKLGSFGIPPEALPIFVDRFELDNRHLLEWYQNRKELDRFQSMTVPSSVSAQHQSIVPRPNDVLFGRFRSNTGNRTLRNIVSSLLDEYSVLPKKYKTLMAEEVRKAIGDLGGRFLKLNSAGEWEEVSQAEAVHKTAKTFRNCRRSAHENGDS
eukprot:scaffold4002_cov85-Cylindrotheca_fusiformis.AAC.4